MNIGKFFKIFVEFCTIGSFLSLLFSIIVLLRTQTIEDLKYSVVWITVYIVLDKVHEVFNISLLFMEIDEINKWLDDQEGDNK